MPDKKIGVGIIIVFISSIIISSPAFLSAQDLESAGREVDRLEKDLGERFKRPIPKPAVITTSPEPVATEEGERFWVTRIELVGAEGVPPETFSQLLSLYENRNTSFSELERLVSKIEQEYLRLGIVAAVFIPEQEVKDGVVVINVVEAKLGKVIIQPHKFFNNKRLARYWEIIPGDLIDYSKVSRSLQRMSKNQDREAKAALAQGEKPGTTDVIVSANTRFPLHLLASFDNQGITSTGKSRIGFGARHNNFLGLDDTLVSGYNYGDHFNGSYVYHSLPLGYRGTSVMYGYSHSHSSPKKEYAPIGVNSDLKSTSVSLRQDLYNKETYLGEVYAGFHAKDKSVKTVSGTLNRDRQRIFSLGGSFVLREPGSTTTIAPEINQGVNAFGASPKDNPLASRGAEPEFTKFNLDINHMRILPLNLQGNVRFRTQLASAKLAPQEEMDLGGISSVRGYPSSDYSADCGGIVNTELLIPAFFFSEKWKLPYAKNTLKDQTTFVLFCDYGYGMRRDALSTEKRNVNMIGAGAGVRFNVYNQALLRLEWGFPVGGSRPITEAGNSQFHFSVDFQDKLPEEIARILRERLEEKIRILSERVIAEEFVIEESGFRERILGYFYQGNIFYENGDYHNARQSYVKAIDLVDYALLQAKEYVRLCMAHEKDIREDMVIAGEFLRQGMDNRAIEIWERVITDATPKKFVLNLTRRD
ncbi:MAG: hypothetical protein FJZ12_00425 [Candidatus Omnitrophica bacterium]|nr:hypothetical protein [Candidatus Omnitrophota bacterium]